MGTDPWPVADQDDPENWSEADWIDRLDKHAERYGLGIVSIAAAVDLINRNHITIDADGKLICRTDRARFIIDALVEMGRMTQYGDV